MKPIRLQKMRSTEPCFGTFLSSGSPTVAELAAQCGFDWLLLDMEHGCLPEAELLMNLRAVSAHDVVVIVRVPTHEASLIGRVLDWGADGIMAPHVESAEEAKSLVAAMRYPPDGNRGYSRSVRAYGYGLNSSEVAEKPLCFVQIESIQGIENAQDIAGVEGVDVLFVGPADLQLSLSTSNSSLSFETALAQVIESAHNHDVFAGILIRDRNETGKFLNHGFTKVAVDSDLSILRAGFHRAASRKSIQVSASLDEQI